MRDTGCKNKRQCRQNRAFDFTCKGKRGQTHGGHYEPPTNTDNCPFTLRAAKFHDACVNAEAKTIAKTNTDTLSSEPALMLASR